jgi:uncharacterized protein (DUF1697 family)
MRAAAFVRSLNVGTHNRITMARLVELASSAGVTNVRTHQVSGNLVFDTRKKPEAVATALEQAFAGAGLTNAAVMVRPLEALEALTPPFSTPETDERQCVTFLRERSDVRLDLAALSKGGVELLEQHADVLYARFFRGAKVPNPNDAIEKALRTKATTRFWNVVQAVTALAARRE